MLRAGDSKFRSLGVASQRLDGVVLILRAGGASGVADG